MQHAPAFHRSHLSWRLLLPVLAFVALLPALGLSGGDGARGSGVLVIIEDASDAGSGSFPGTVCYQLMRDYDGAVISEGCFAIAVSIVAPAGFEPGLDYTISISLADPTCVLLDDPRSGTGETPFRIRVACEAGPPTTVVSTIAPDSGAIATIETMSPIEWEYRDPAADEVEPTAPPIFEAADATPAATPIVPFLGASGADETSGT